jgi:hypothetical protein
MAANSFKGQSGTLEMHIDRIVSLSGRLRCCSNFDESNPDLPCETVVTITDWPL